MFLLLRRHLSAPLLVLTCLIVLLVHVRTAAGYPDMVGYIASSGGTWPPYFSGTNCYVFGSVEAVPGAYVTDATM